MLSYYIKGAHTSLRVVKSIFFLQECVFLLKTFHLVYIKPIFKSNLKNHIFAHGVRPVFDFGRPFWKTLKLLRCLAECMFFYYFWPTHFNHEKNFYSDGHPIPLISNLTPWLISFSIWVFWSLFWQYPTFYGKIFQKVPSTAERKKISKIWENRFSVMYYSTTLWNFSKIAARIKDFWGENAFFEGFTELELSH